MRKSYRLWLNVLGVQGFTLLPFPLHLLGLLFDELYTILLLLFSIILWPQLYCPHPCPLPSCFPEDSLVYCGHLGFKGSAFKG